jgi:hypothetical protein
MGDDSGEEKIPDGILDVKNFFNILKMKKYFFWTKRTENNFQIPNPKFQTIKF